MIKNPTILSIDTSCDETSASVTKGLVVLSNIVWSQSSIHAKFGGVVPSVARRQHERKITWVVEKAVKSSGVKFEKLEAVAVTVGPGLAIALGVGINFAIKLSQKYKLPLIAVNHLEAHVLSAFAQANKNKNSSTNAFAVDELCKQKKLSFGIVVSGGNTLFCFIKSVGEYQILGATIDDALGESLDKSARVLGLGYPGGAVLEKFAKKGNAKKYPLPLPLLGRENEGLYSYSGIKTAFNRLVTSLTLKNDLKKQEIYDLAASYQKIAFDHFFRVTEKTITKYKTSNTSYLLIGGGVAANVDFRKRVRVLCKKHSLVPLFPFSKKLYGDNAAMIGVVAYFKYLKKQFTGSSDIDRKPDLKLGGKSV